MAIGVVTIEVADVADLRTFAPSAGVVAYQAVIRNASTSWRLEKASTAADDGVDVLKPDSVGEAGPGRWHRNTSTDVAEHVAESDPHAQYQLRSEKGVAGGYPSLDGGGTIPDAQIPAAIARDSEVSAAIAAHESAGNPHPVYLTQAEADALYDALGAAAAAIVAHEAAGNPHPQYLTQAEADVLYDAIGAAAAAYAAAAADLAAHVAAADPHTQYQRESEKNAANGYPGLDGSSKLNGAQQTYGSAPNTACVGDDARLSDARTPTAHALGGAEHSADTLANLNAKVSDADLVALAGQLGGSTASPDVRGLRESGGPTLLTLAAVADGKFLKRQGTDIVGADAGGAGASWTIVETDVGSTPKSSGRFTITDAAISPTSKVIVQQAPGPYTGKGTLADEASMDPIWCVAVPGSGSAVVYWRTMAGISIRRVTEGDFSGRTNLAAAPQDDPQARVEAVVIGRVRGNIKFQYSVAS